MPTYLIISTTYFVFGFIVFLSGACFQKARIKVRAELCSECALFPVRLEDYCPWLFCVFNQFNDYLKYGTWFVDRIVCLLEWDLSISTSVCYSWSNEVEEFGVPDWFLKMSSKNSVLPEYMKSYMNYVMDLFFPQIQIRFCWNHFDMVYVVAVHHHDKKVRIPSSGGLLFSFIEPNVGITLIIYTALCSSTIWLCVIPG